jgi:glucosamine-6-phosphate deaminase
MTDHPARQRRSSPGIFVAQSSEEFVYAAAEQVKRQLQARADSVLALPTGQTPIGLYQELARRCREEDLSFAEARTFNLDEFVDLPAEHRASFDSFMLTHLFSHIDIDLANVRVPNGNAPNLDQECRAYEREIAAAGGIDLAIIGIGVNGHIAFNEPGTPFDSRTRVVELTLESRQAHADEFGGLEFVPAKAITIGIGTIMEARRIVLLASGSEKAEIVARAIEGPMTRSVPASALQNHPNVLFILDKQATTRLHGQR